MRVLIGIPCLLIGGTEIQTLNLVKALTANAHQVTTLCYYEYLSKMVLDYEQAGSQVECLSLDGTRVSAKEQIPFLYKGLKNALKNYRPDIIHIQYMTPGAIPIFLLRILGFRRIIATLHTSANAYKSTQWVRFIQKYAVKAFTCITQEAEKSFFGSSELYADNTVLGERNHFTIYNVLPAYISIKNDQKRQGKPLLIGVVSRLEYIKGMDLVIPAFAQILNHHPHARLLIIGNGTLYQQMKTETEKLGIINQVSFEGQQAPENLQTFYDRIDILLMPSRSEGFGLTAIEGMARGCVVVASNTGGLPEVVKHEEVGLLHRSESVQDMVAKICMLINLPDKWQQLSDNARNYVQKYSFSNFNYLVNTLYQKL